MVQFNHFDHCKTISYVILALITGLLTVSSATADEAPPDAEWRKEIAVLEKHLFPFIEAADRITVYSLFPCSQKTIAEDIRYVANTAFGRETGEQLTAADIRFLEAAKKAPTFDHYPVLGKVEIRDEKTLKRLRTMLVVNAGTFSQPDGDIAEQVDDMCPSHGVRLHRGQDTLDLFISFSYNTCAVAASDSKLADFIEGPLHHFQSELCGYLDALLDKNDVMRLIDPWFLKKSASTPREQPMIDKPTASTPTVKD